MAPWDFIAGHLDEASFVGAGAFLILAYLADRRYERRWERTR